MTSVEGPRAGGEGQDDDKYQLAFDLICDGQHQRALDILNEILLLRVDAFPDSEMWLAVSHMLGLEFWKKKNYKGAADVHRKSLALRQLGQGEDSLEAAKARLALAKDLHQLKKYTEARDLNLRNIELCGKDPSNPKGLIGLESQSELALNLFKQLKYRESVEIGRELLILREEHLLNAVEGPTSKERRQLAVRRNMIRHSLALSLHELATLQSCEEAAVLNQENLDSWKEIGGKSNVIALSEKALKSNRESISIIRDSQIAEKDKVEQIEKPKESDKPEENNKTEENKSENEKPRENDKPEENEKPEEYEKSVLIVVSPSLSIQDEQGLVTVLSQPGEVSTIEPPTEIKGPSLGNEIIISATEIKSSNGALETLGDSRQGPEDVEVIAEGMPGFAGPRQSNGRANSFSQIDFFASKEKEPQRPTLSKRSHSDQELGKNIQSINNRNISSLPTETTLKRMSNEEPLISLTRSTKEPENDYEYDPSIPARDHAPRLVQEVPPASKPTPSPEDGLKVVENLKPLAASETEVLLPAINDGSSSTSTGQAISAVPVSNSTGSISPTGEATAAPLVNIPTSSDNNNNATAPHPQVKQSKAVTKPELTPNAKASDEWFRKLDDINLVLRKLRKAPQHERVKIAILDTGIYDKPHPYWTQISGYKDFVSREDTKGIDKTGHGTNGVHLIWKILPEAEIYVARVFDESAAAEDTPSLMAEAIKYAREEWKVHIITISAGFRDDYKEIRTQVLLANIDDILIFAAASNSGREEYIAFPARLQGVICIFSSSANCIPSQAFNPSLSNSSKLNFCFLGEEVEKVPKEITDNKGRASGTSASTSIAAAIAARVIDFSRHADCRERIPEQEREKLRTVAGMSIIFQEMATREDLNGYKCVIPGKMLECSETYMRDWDIKRKREIICDNIYHALRWMNKA